MKAQPHLLQLAGVMFGVLLHTTSVPAQVDQHGLAEQLLRGGAVERRQALNEANALGPQNIGPELRAALIQALKHQGQIREQRYHADQPADDPQFIFPLSRLVAELQDPRAIPALTGALGTGSGSPVIRALVGFGEQAVPALLDAVTSPQTIHYVVYDALLVLRFLVEGAGPDLLSPGTLERIRVATHQRLMERQSGIGTTLRRAIDLAVALDAPDLRRIVQAIATDRNELIARGLTEPDLIEATQKRAAARLAGVPPTPRWRS